MADEVAAALFECLLIDTPLDKAHWCAEERDRRCDVMTSSSAKKKEKRQPTAIIIITAQCWITSLIITHNNNKQKYNICSPERKATVLDFHHPHVPMMSCVLSQVGILLLPLQ